MGESGVKWRWGSCGELCVAKRALSVDGGGQGRNRKHVGAYRSLRLGWAGRGGVSFFFLPALGDGACRVVPGVKIQGLFGVLWSEDATALFAGRGAIYRCWAVMAGRALEQAWPMRGPESHRAPACTLASSSSLVESP